MILQQASSVQVDKVDYLLHHVMSCDAIIFCKMDYNMVDNLNELRDACLEAYTGILQGLRGPDTRNFSREC